METVQKKKLLFKGLVYSASLPQIITLIIFFLIGLFCLLISFMSIPHLSYKETTAIVVDMKYDSEMKGYLPTYEYNYNGKKVRIKGYFTLNEDIKIGDKEVIKYNPKDYKDFDVGSTKDEIAIFALGVLFIFISSVSLYKYYKIAKSKEFEDAAEEFSES